MEYTVGRGLCSDTKASVSTFLVDMPSATPSEKNARSCAEPGQERRGDKVVAPPGTLLSIITQPLLLVNTRCVPFDWPFDSAQGMAQDSLRRPVTGPSVTQRYSDPPWIFHRPRTSLAKILPTRTYFMTAAGK